MAQIDNTVIERLAAAVRSGDEEQAIMLLTRHPDCRAFLDLGESLNGHFRDSISDSLLRIDSWSRYAEAHGHRELGSTLVRDFWDPIYRGVYEAIRLGNVRELDHLFDKHPRYIDCVEGGIDSWLNSATYYGHIEIMKLLVKFGADVNARPPHASTPLATALSFAGIDVVEYLLATGAKIEGGDPDGERPLVSAVGRNPEDFALQLVQLLVEHGADVNWEYTLFGDKGKTFTALEWAAGKPKVAEYLRSKGAVERKKKVAERTTPRCLSEEIVAYFDEHFGPPQPQAQIEIVPTDPPIAVHLIPSAENRKHLTLFTTGMSNQPMHAPDGTDDFRFAEVFIQLPAAWPIDKEALSHPEHGWPITWLRSIAKYPYQQNTWLGGPVTIIANGDPPEPLAPGIQFTSLLVMADRELTARDGRKIYFYRLTPLYTEEHQLELDHGVAALMRALDENDVPSVVHLTRQNVALKGKG